MLIEFGNSAPIDVSGAPVNLGAPSVTYISIPDSYTFNPSLDIRDFAVHVAQNPNITNLPDSEVLLTLAHASGGLWKRHSTENPVWVWSDNADVERYLSNFYSTTEGRPAAVEDTHYTAFGPPGVGAWGNKPTANITTSGRDIWANAMGGGQVGTTGTATSTSATTLVNTGASWTTNQWAGRRVVAGGVWGNVWSNTATVLNVDRWYAPASPGGSVGSTPGGTSVYVVLDGAAPSWFMGLSTSTTPLLSPSTNTTLPGEITTSGGGLARKICAYAHTSGVNSFTLTGTFTANSSDILPTVVASVGVFNSMVPADASSTMLLNTMLASTATLQNIGDQLILTDVIGGS